MEFKSLVDKRCSIFFSQGKASFITSWILRGFGVEVRGGGGCSDQVFSQNRKKTSLCAKTNLFSQVVGLQSEMSYGTSLAPGARIIEPQHAVSIHKTFVRETETRKQYKRYGVVILRNVVLQQSTWKNAGRKEQFNPGTVRLPNNVRMVPYESAGRHGSLRGETFERKDSFLDGMKIWCYVLKVSLPPQHRHREGEARFQV